MYDLGNLDLDLPASAILLAARITTKFYTFLAETKFKTCIRRNCKHEVKTVYERYVIMFIYCNGLNHILFISY